MESRLGSSAGTRLNALLKAVVWLAAAPEMAKICIFPCYPSISCQIRQDTWKPAAVGQGKTFNPQLAGRQENHLLRKMIRNIQSASFDSQEKRARWVENMTCMHSIANFASPASRLQAVAYRAAARGFRPRSRIPENPETWSNALSDQRS